jgi:hypothetical protein
MGCRGLTTQPGLEAGGSCCVPPLKAVPCDAAVLARSTQVLTGRLGLILYGRSGPVQAKSGMLMLRLRPLLVQKAHSEVPALCADLCAAHACCRHRQQAASWCHSAT